MTCDAGPEALAVRRFRADPRSYLLFAIVFGLLTLFMLITTWRTGSWDAPATFVTLLVASVYWLSRFEIALSSQAIEYRSLFGRRAVNWSDVQGSELQVGVRSYSDRFKPRFRLVIRAHGPNANRPLVINLKPFRREDIAALLSMSELKLAQRDDVA